MRNCEGGMRLAMICLMWLATGCGAVLLESDNCIEMTGLVTFRFGVETLPADPNALVIDGVHTDLETAYVCDAAGCGWEFAVSPEDGPHGGDEIAPDAAWLYVGTAARYTLASIPDRFRFIGANPGEVFWILPQNASAAPGALFAGFCSEHVSAWVKDRLCPWNPQEPRAGADAWGKWLYVRLIDVRRPPGGEFSMWQIDEFGTLDVHWSTREGGIGPEDVYHYTVGGHTHMNWGFTKPGFYEVDLSVSTYYRCDAALTADLNADCYVDLRDLAVVGRHWRKPCDDPNSCNANLVPPPGVALEDLTAVADQWLRCGSPFASECP